MNLRFGTSSKPLLFLITGAIIVFLYLFIVWLTTGANPSLNFDFVGGKSVYNVDDAWRFYIARASLFNIAYYSWDFVLPVALFVDSITIHLSGGDLFLSRIYLIARSALVFYFITQTCRMLGTSFWTGLAGSLSVVLMPLFIFVSTSFYGESLLCVLLAGAIYFYIRKNYGVSTLLFSLLPLTRPEGIFYMAPVALKALQGRQYKTFILLGTPGFLYFLYLVFVIPDLNHLFEHRLEWRDVIKSYIHESRIKDPANPFELFALFNALWIVLAVCGFLFRPLRDFWFLWAGSIAWIAFLISQHLTYMADYQPRYYASIVPVFGIGFGFCVHVLSRSCARHKKRIQKFCAISISMLIVLVILENFLQVDALKYRLSDDRRWPVPGRGAATDGVTMEYNAEKRSRASVARLAEKIVMKNNDIDILFVNDYRLFPYLRPSVLESEVKVMWLESTPAIALHLNEGRFFAAHPYGKKYSYYELRPGPDSADGAAIFLGDLDEFGWPASYSAGEYGLYGVGYIKVDNDDN